MLWSQPLATEFSSYPEILKYWETLVQMLNEMRMITHPVSECEKDSQCGTLSFTYTGQYPSESLWGNLEDTPNLLRRMTSLQSRALKNQGVKTGFLSRSVNTVTEFPAFPKLFLRLEKHSRFWAGDPRRSAHSPPWRSEGEPALPDSSFVPFKICFVAFPTSTSWKSLWGSHIWQLEV